MSRFTSRPLCGFRRRQRASGFSLIEVLIAMFVIAVGLLGFALLQTMVVRYVQSSNYRTQASNLAYDLFDQVRANRALMMEYNNITAASFTGVDGENCERSVSDLVTANESMNRWRCQVRSALGPGATADVAAQNDGNIAVVVRWSDARGTVGGDADPGDDDDYGRVTVRTRL